MSSEKISFLLKKIISYLLRTLSFYIIQAPRILLYRIMSKRIYKSVGCKISQPILAQGAGKISIGRSSFGVWNSPFFYNGHTILNARMPQSVISIGDNCYFNNSTVIISESSQGIYIHNNVLVGYNVQIFDSDFHDLDPSRRFGGCIRQGRVVISENVYIGSNTVVLRGVTIGENSVIGACSVVTKDVPSNCIAAGNPCKVIKYL